jgi:hypothetical protein
VSGRFALTAGETEANPEQILQQIAKGCGVTATPSFAANKKGDADA